MPKLYHLTGKLASKYDAGMAKKKPLTITEFARLGGKARAAKFPKATLSKWAKKGGRPRKEGKGNAN